MKKGLWKVLLLAGCLAAVGAPVSATSQENQLSIVAPQANSTILGGSRISIVVGMRVRDRVDYLALIGSLPGLDGMQELSDGRRQYTVSVPQNVRFGRYEVRAIAKLANGDRLESAPLVIHTAPAVDPVALRVNEGPLFIRGVGKQVQLETLAVYEGGKVASLFDASELSCDVSDRGVVVPQRGCSELLAVGTGKAVVSFAFRGLRKSLDVVVDQGSRGDLDGNGKIDAWDLGLLEGAMGRKATTKGDARDLNADGLIDSKDLAELRALCSRPNCAKR